MRRSVALLSLVALGACTPEPVDLGELSLELWQVPGPGQTPFLDEAEEVVVDVTIENTTSTHAVNDDGLTEAIEAAPEGASVRLVLRASGPFGEATAWPAPFEVAPGGDTVTRRAVLALPGLTTLSDAAPDARQRAAACGDGEGAALFVGGSEGAALAFGSFLLDPVDESVGEGPGLLDRRTGASCVVRGESAWLLGGCDVDGTPRATLERSDLRGGPFEAAGDPVPASTGCGAALAVTADGFALLAGAVLERRDADGRVVDEVALPVAHYGGSIAEHPAGGVVVAGGYEDPEQIASVSAGHWWRTTGEVETLAGLGTGALLSPGHDELLAITDDGRLVTLTTEGGIDERFTSDVVALTAPPAALAPSASGGAWVLTGAGDEVVELSTRSGRRALSLTPPRPGGQLVAGPGGSTWLGGGATGAELLQP
jgi:hypothetical protein